MLSPLRSRHPLCSTPSLLARADRLPIARRGLPSLGLPRPPPVAPVARAAQSDWSRNRLWVKRLAYSPMGGVPVGGSRPRPVAWPVPDEDPREGRKLAGFTPHRTPRSGRKIGVGGASRGAGGGPKFGSERGPTGGRNCPKIGGEIGGPAGGNFPPDPGRGDKKSQNSRIFFFLDVRSM